jgi:hypothetical protein
MLLVASRHLLVATMLAAAIKTIAATATELALPRTAAAVTSVG